MKKNKLILTILFFITNCIILKIDKNFVVNSKELYCSLRSKRNGGVDVSAIAKKFGGGGHATSAAFKIPPHNLPKLLSGKLTPQPCLAERILDRVIIFLERIRYSYCK